MCVCFGSMCITFFLLRDLFFTYFASFFYLVIHSILFHYIHAFIWISCAPLIILDHFYVSQVKLSSFLYPLSIMTKRGRNYGDCGFFFFRILHVRGRNTCLCKGKICFILLGGVLTSFFLYTSPVTTIDIHCTYFLYMLMYVSFAYPYMCCFFSPFIHMVLILVCNLLFLFHTKMP